jgi:hypothetical protein
MRQRLIRGHFRPQRSTIPSGMYGMSYGRAEYLQYVAHAMGSATHSLSLCVRCVMATADIDSIRRSPATRKTR